MKFYPIFIPSYVFKNKHNEPDGLIETNPSFFYSKETKKFKILVRMVNYRKYQGNLFCLSENKSKSFWHYYEISLDELKERGGIGIVEKGDFVSVINPFPKYETYWQGIEDIRFLSENLIMAVSPENNPNCGLPRMVLGKFDCEKFQIQITNLLEPSQSEKNWLPFPEGVNMVLYKVLPFEIKETLNDKFVYKMDSSKISKEAMKLAEKYLGGGYHGSTNGVEYEKGVLFLIHNSSGCSKTKHRWIWVADDFEKSKTIKTNKEEFFFVENSYIEFPCSLDIIEDKIYVSLGINDNKAFIVSDVPFPLLDVEINLLTPD